MAATGFKGVDCRQTGNQLVFRAFLQDSSGAKVTSGTTTIALYELESDGTIKSYDFNDNTFKTTALTTATGSMTHRTGNNSTVNTGVWTYTLSTLTGFTIGAVYLAQVNNSGASPTDQTREFQYGGAEGDLLVTAGSTGQAYLQSDVKAINAVSTSSVTTVSANVGTTQPVNFTGTGTTAYVKAGLWEILGTVLTETAGQIAAAFKQFFNIASPTSTMNRITLVDTLTTYTGNTPQSGDNFGIVNNGTYGNAALLSAIQNVQNNTFIATSIPYTLERPDSSSTSISISIVFSDETGAAKNLDSGSPAITLVNDAGTDRSGRLGSITNPATGKYVVAYTNTSTDTIEGLHWDITGTINSKSRRMVAYTQIVDTTAVDFTSSDRTDLQAIKTQALLIATNAADSPNAVTAQTSVAGLRAAYTDARAAKLDNLDTATSAAIAKLTTIIRVLGQTSGAVWFVATTGNDSTGDGLSWATAYRLPTKAASVAAAGDTILVGPDVGATVYAMGNAVVNLPDGVSIFGSGQRRTTITSTAVLGTLGAIVKPGSGSVIAHLGIVAVAANAFQACFGFHTGASTPQTTASNWKLDDVYLEGDTDGIYLNDTSGTPAQVRAEVRDCVVRTKYDTCTVLAGGAWDLIVSLTGFNDFRALGPSLVFGGPNGTSRAIVVNNGTIRAFGGYYEASGSSIENYAVAVGDGGSDVTARIEVAGGYLVSSGTGAKDAYNHLGTLILSGTQYDTTKTTGGITLRTAPPLEYLDASVNSRMATFSYTAPDNTDIVSALNDLVTLLARTDPSTALTAIKAVTDGVATMLTASGGNKTFTVDALKNAPAGGGGSGNPKQVIDKQRTIIDRPG